MKTPWAEYVTTGPENITCMRVPHRREDNHINMVMTLGETEYPLVYGRIDVVNSAIYIKDPDCLLDTHSPAYHLRLQRWTRNRLPCIDLHPFAILHLLATQQVPRRELLELASTAASGQPSLRMSVTSRCQLREMLGVPRVVLRFSSAYDMAIREIGFA